MSYGCYVIFAGAGPGGGESKPYPIPKFSVTSVGIILNQRGVKPPLNHPANRTLVQWRPYRSGSAGLTSGTRVILGRLKMRDQIAGVETAGKVSMESQSVKKCLKVFVCRVIPSV